MAVAPTSDDKEMGWSLFVLLMKRAGEGMFIQNQTKCRNSESVLAFNIDLKGGKQSTKADILVSTSGWIDFIDATEYDTNNKVGTAWAYARLCMMGLYRGHENSVILAYMLQQVANRCSHLGKSKLFKEWKKQSENIVSRQGRRVRDKTTLITASAMR